MGVQERRERERDARRKSVLDATRTLVRERGFNGTTTRQIADRCELSEATVFFYFNSKDEIVTSLLLEGIDFMARGLDEIAAARLDRRQRIVRLWRFFGKVRAEHPEYTHVFSYLAHPQATATVPAEVKAELARRSGDNFRRLAALLDGKDGGSTGRVAADLIWAAFVGLSVLRDSRENLGARAHPTERELGVALELLLGGVASPAKRGKR